MHYVNLKILKCYGFFLFTLQLFIYSNFFLIYFTMFLFLITNIYANSNAAIFWNNYCILKTAFKYLITSFLQICFENRKLFSNNWLRQILCPCKQVLKTSALEFCWLHLRLCFSSVYMIFRQNLKTFTTKLI